MINRKTHNNPIVLYIITDLMLLWLSFCVVLAWFPLVAKNPFEKYFLPVLIFTPIFFFSGIAFRKYHSYRFRSMRNVLASVFQADLLVLFLSLLAVYLLPLYKISVNVIAATTFGVFLIESFFVLVYFSFRYAANAESSNAQPDVKDKHSVLKENHLLDEKTTSRIESLIKENSGEATLSFLQDKIQLTYANTLVLYTTSIFNVQNLAENRFSIIVNLKKTNNIRGINEFLVAVHDKLPYLGTYVGCFRSKSAYKKDFLARYPFGLNYILYFFNYILKRVFPKWKFTREFYFWLTDGRKRILSKAEVFGRLYCAGFEIQDEFKADGMVYFIATKKKEPIRQEVINYGQIVKLKRVGKKGRIFNVYKFRTMHPYSEYLQSYIYEKNKLQEGGKFNHDIRITSLGGFMRKYWLDELPMFLNLFKGDMKLVGVRPLSKQYFSLYSSELQEKRTLVKPGLLPPFYAHMPKSLDEIQASEMKYLTECEEKGTYSTDLKYLWLIFVNIFFRRARSK